MEGNVQLVSSWASGYGIRVQIALKAKGIPFEYIEQDISNKSQLLLESNPVHKKVPVLLHNGKPICESLLIIQYIDETWPTTPLFMPQDPYDRYLMRFWCDYKDTKHSQVRAHFMGAKGKSREERRIAMEKAREEYDEMLITMESGVAEMGRRGLLYDGRELKYMDVSMAPTVGWFEGMDKLLGFGSVNGEKCPLLKKWADSLLSNEVVKSTLPDAAALTDYARERWGVDEVI